MANESFGTLVVFPINKVLGKQMLVKRQRGRPRKVERRPSINQSEYNAAVGAACESSIASDSLVVALQGDRRGPEIIHAVTLGIAMETAALGLLRRQQQAEGKDTAQISSRRVSGLGQLANVFLELSTWGGGAIDLRSPKLQILLDLFVDDVFEAALATVPADKAAEVVTEFRTAVAGWENRIGLR
jgi:hypothetical protein